MKARGYFGIGIYGCKNSVNIGTLWRSASNLSAAFIFTVGKRYRQQSSDTTKAFKHIPLLEYQTVEDLKAGLPRDCLLIGVEQAASAVPLPLFAHPERAAYLLGAEDFGLPESVIEKCHRLIEIPSEHCLNVSTAGSIVMYDRNTKGSVAQWVERRSEAPRVGGSIPPGAVAA